MVDTRPTPTIMARYLLRERSASSVTYPVHAAHSSPKLTPISSAAMTQPSHNPSIKTDIFEFCQTFAGILKPFATALNTTRTLMQEKGDPSVLQRPLAGFADVTHRLENLVHKVEEQQAYLIIFGPLKSGKSTLMNAISAAYVSEVTSLPAYPCLVHVKHGDDYNFVASRYNGEKLRFPDNASLQKHIKESHKTLADRLREIEESGEKFDPGVHYPEAIRRVDVAVPTRNMKDSLTVLVDTPGLYTRMKFGYDLMTREFRNSAACAVFVVKTDNLFLEQVFEEFNELLDLFSRIFIVVNIDSNKHDLEPDGSLKPSLESRAPGEVIRAFESLVMSAPLRHAQAQGRLKIYPIDLLNSASAAIRQPLDAPHEAEHQDAACATEESAELATAEVAEIPASEPVEAPFGLFLKDLTDYLNSSDYIHEFMGDALLMGANLTHEIHHHCSQQATAALEDSRQVLAADLADTQARLNTVEQLQALDIKGLFAQLRSETRKHTEEVSKSAVVDALRKSLAQLEQWYASDASVIALQEEWSALLAACGKRVNDECQLKLRSLVAGQLGGLRISDSLRASAVGLDELLAPVVTAARTTLNHAESALHIAPFHIEPEHLKVSKSLWDWLSFRSLAAIRRRIFGRAEAMDRAVPATVKEKRMGEAGKQLLEERIINELSRQFPGEAVRVSDAMLTAYADTLGKELTEKSRAAKEKHAARQADLTKRIQDNLAIRQKLDEVSTQAHDLLAEVDQLGDRFQSSSRATGTPGTVDAETDTPAEVPADAAAGDEAPVIPLPFIPVPDGCDCAVNGSSNECAV